MRLSDVVRALVSGLVVYVVAAACGASERIASTGDSGPSTTSAGDGVDAANEIEVGGSESESGIVDAFLDELGNPVHDAKAGPNGPDLADERCDKVLKYNAAGTNQNFAVHSYPGKTARELGAVQVLIPSTGVEGYTAQVSTGAWVKDGSAAYLCGGPIGAPTIPGVTFVLP